MKEQTFLEIIQKQTNSTYLGDDCAHLEELGIVVTQDNFIEDVHFKTNWATPFQIGYKACAVNISDILASGAKPEYLTIGLSLPNHIDNVFVKELYKGIQASSYGAKVIGGDITGGNKIFISITAIGKTTGRKISSRKNAKSGHVVIASGNFGESSIGLKQLQSGIKDSNFIKIHLEPELDVKFSEEISINITSDYAMMDTSDGLADALFKIAHASNVKIVCDNIQGAYGAEDYKLVATVPEDFVSKISNYKIIGKVKDFDGNYLQIGTNNYKNYNELEVFDHFSY